MSIFNSQKEYGLLAKLFHWITFVILIVQIPFGFYLVGLEFSDRRIDLENIHILIGITVFYITLFRLIWKFFNQSPTVGNSCLLYTSPSPRDAHESRMPSSA